MNPCNYIQLHCNFEYTAQAGSMSEGIAIKL